MAISAGLGALSADFPVAPPAWTIEPAAPAQQAPAHAAPPVVDERVVSPA